jgi:hypothetical protein
MTYPTVELGEELSIKNINNKIASFTVMEVRDDPYRKLLSVGVILNNGLSIQILLWKDDEYDKAGQWTDTALQNALIPVVKEKIKNYPSPPKPVTLKPFVLPQPKQPEVKNTFPGFFPKPA